MITNVLAPLKLLHLEAPFRENGINGQVFMYLTDVRPPFDALLLRLTATNAIFACRSVS